VATKADRDAVLVLAHLEGLTPIERHALAWREGSAAACVRAVAGGGAQAASARDREIAAGLEPARVGQALSACGARVVLPGDGEYAEPLLALSDPPVCLFIRGAALVPWPPAVAVVGSRTCTPYGREVAETMAGDLARAGVVVISGAALGIDGTAHRGAIDAGGTTIAVLGSGIDVPHPRTNQRLIEEIARSGAVISEYPPGTPAQRHRFPARNRLVAALARAVVVVEGAEGSGSLITVEFASDLGRDVMAVPGPVTGPLSAVPHALIRDGAPLVREAADVLEALQLDPEAFPASPAGGSSPGTPTTSGLSSDERAVLDLVPGTPVTVDAVAGAAGLSVAEALRALAALELRGLVSADGGRYRRSSAPAGTAGRRAAG
jgi:DNA processing protein